MWPFKKRSSPPPPPSPVAGNDSLHTSDTYVAVVRPENSHLLHGRVVSNTYWDGNRVLVIQTEEQRVRLIGCTELVIEPLNGPLDLTFYTRRGDG